MADLLNVMGHVTLTGVTRKLDFPEFVLAPNVPVRPIDGDVAQWTVQKQDVRIHNYFGGADMPAMPVRMGDYYNKSFVMFHRFASKSVGGGLLQNLDKPGTTEFDSAFSLVVDELNNLKQRVGAYTDEFLVAQAIQGSLSINIGNDAFSTAQTIDYEIPAGNKITSGTAWSAAAADILEDLRVAKERAQQYGVKPVMMVMNQKTANYVHKNTTIQNYIKEYNAGRDIIEMGTIPKLCGLQPIVIDTQYADVNQTDRLEKKFIADGKVILLPAWPASTGDWIEFQEGRFVIPNEMQNGFTWMQGEAAWTRTTDSPSCWTMYYKYVRFPVIRKPWAIVVLTVV